MRARAFAFVLAGLGVTACSLFIDSSGFTSGDDPVPDAEVGLDGSPNVDGAGGVDASSDAPPIEDPDAKVDAPYVACPSYALLCDDFESGNLGKWSGLSIENAGTVSVTTSPVFRGTSALHVHRTPPDGSSGSFTEANVFKLLSPSLTTGMLVIRAHIRFAKMPAPETTILKMKTTPTDDDANLKLTSTGTLKIDTDTPGAGADKTSTAIPTANEWFCVEWQMTFGADGHQTLYLNGAKVIDVAEDTASTGAWNEVEVGFAETNIATEDDLFYDDVAIATQPLPCP